VPGEVSNVGETNFRIAAAGGQIQVKRVRPDGDKKMTAAEFAQAGGLTDGARLG
jgi:methionyl-tRNA formyltransferase